MGDLNRILFLAINAGEHPPGLTTAVAIVAAKYLVLLVPAHILLVWAGGDRRMRFVALSAALTVGLALAINQAIGFVAYSPRPFMIGLGHQLIDHRDSSSLPSNHATLFFAYAAGLAVYRRTMLACMAVLLGCIVGWSRIYLGIHFPLDMLAAVVTSALAALGAASISAQWGTMLLHRLEALQAGLGGLRIAPGNPHMRR